MTVHESTSTTEEIFEANLCDCTACLLIPLSVLALEVDRPMRGWDELLKHEGIKVIPDHLGRPSIAALAARRLIATRRRQAELTAEDAKRRTEELTKKYPRRTGRAIPAQEGMTPYESLAAAGGIVTPEQEFGLGREKPRFLEEAIEAGQRELAEKKRRTAERKRELAENIIDKLTGKR